MIVYGMWQEKTGQNVELNLVAPFFLFFPVNTFVFFFRLEE